MQFLPSQKAPCLEELALGLKLWCHQLEILHNILTRVPHFHLVLGPANYMATV